MSTKVRCICSQQVRQLAVVSASLPLDPAQHMLLTRRAHSLHFELLLSRE